MALAMTGRVADGLILQLADPDLIRWFVGQVREAAAAAGRDPAVDPGPGRGAGPRRRPRELGRERTRWFPALVSQPRRRPRQQVPARAAAGSLTGYIRDRAGYDYHHHAEVGSSNAAFVGDEVTDRFCVLGSADDHVAKLRELAAAGVDQFNLYLMNGDEEAQLEAYGRDVIPALRDDRPAVASPHGQAGQRGRGPRRCADRRRCGAGTRSSDRDMATVEAPMMRRLSARPRSVLG